VPLTIPAFSQYQSPLVPLRGLWNCKPQEGDKFVNAEIDWITSTGGYQAQQFSLSAGPVQMSQIVALFVDNSRSGADVSFIFPDSSFELVAPAHNQLLTPVLTNALSFYASSPQSIAGDVTILQILNSMPPPIPIAPSSAQNVATEAPMAIANGTVQIVPATVSGTLNTLSISINAVAGASAGGAQFNLVDGTGVQIWGTIVSAAANSSQNIPINLTVLGKRFTNGLKLVTSANTLAANSYIVVNAYYTTP
jgi:hypothetical protein